MLPDEMLAMPPAVVKVNTGGKTVNSEQEDKLIGKEVFIRTRRQQLLSVLLIVNRLLSSQGLFQTRLYLRELRLKLFLDMWRQLERCG